VAEGGEMQGRVLAPFTRGAGFLLFTFLFFLCFCCGCHCCGVMLCIVQGLGLWGRRKKEEEKRKRKCTSFAGRELM
jgi:hypothetical protein